MNKVILFYPGDGRTYHWFPFPLMTISTVLAAAGFEPVIIDQRVEKDWKALLHDNIDECLWVGFTMISGPTIGSALEVAAYVRDISPNVPKVFGGFHTSYLPMETVKDDLVDYVYIGAAETSLAEFTRAIERKDGSECFLDNVLSDRIAFRDYELKPCRNVHEYDKYWRSGYDYLSSIEKYRSVNNVAGMFIARSCPFKCAFCSITKMYRYEERNPQYITEELNYLINEQGFQNIVFQDGLVFTGPKIRKLWEHFDVAGIHFEWSGPARANSFKNFSDHDMDFLKRTGFKLAEFGFESGSDRILKRLMKGCMVEDALEVTKFLKHWDLEVCASFMSGVPGEKIEDLQMSIDLIERLCKINDKFFFHMFFYSPVPGSKTYLEMLELGHEPPKSLQGWANVDWNRKVPEKFPWMSIKEFDAYIKLFNKYFGESDYFGVREREWNSWKHAGERAVQSSS